jgi:hypothetical protein
MLRLLIKVYPEEVCVLLMYSKSGAQKDVDS